MSPGSYPVDTMDSCTMGRKRSIFQADSAPLGNRIETPPGTLPGYEAMRKSFMM